MPGVGRTRRIQPLGAIADNFNRTASTLGVTSTGGVPWTVRSGTNWATNGSIATVSDPGGYQGAIATVPLNDANQDVSLTMSSNGGDSLVFRYQDQSNFWRIRSYEVTTTGTTTSTCYTGDYTCQAVANCYNCVPGNPGFSTSICDSLTSCNGSSCGGGANYFCGNNTDGTPCYVACPSTAATQNSNSNCSYSCSQTVYYYNYYLYLEKLVAGAATTVASYGSASGNIYTHRVTAIGSTITVYFNGSAQAAITDSALSTATMCGIGFATSGSGASGSNLDNFSATPK